MVRIIAHRGASSEAPENTLAAIRRAIEIGVDCVEIDVHLTKDHIPVVIHDGRLGRTVQGHGHKQIAHTTYAELKTLDAGSWFDPSFSAEAVPTLHEVLALARNSTALMIEVKKDIHPIELAAEKIGEALASSPALAPPNTTVVGSFSAQFLAKFHSLLPAYPLIGIVEKDHALSDFQEVPLKLFAIWYKLLTPYLVQHLYDEDKEVWAFTVDNLKIAAFLRSIGVQGIITNNPRKLKETLG